MAYSFDWQRFLDRNGIDYVTSGHNARRYVIATKCPWCGDADPSQHLGISTRGKGYNCWRNKAHGGVAPHKLIMALLGCGYEQAQAICNAEGGVMGLRDETFAGAMLRGLGFAESAPARPINNATALEFLPEFKLLTEGGMAEMFALPYLRERGYDTGDALRLAKRFDLRYAMTGRFAYRIIVPVFLRGKLVTWTGRSFHFDKGLRYKTLASNAETAAAQGLPPALVNIKHTLFDFDELNRGGDTLVVTEGPFDAMRVSFFGEAHGIIGTALFNKAASPQQLDLLLSVAPKFDRRVLLVDRDAQLEALFILPDREFLTTDFELMYLPSTVHDPAELTFDEFTLLLYNNKTAKLLQSG